MNPVKQGPEDLIRLDHVQALTAAAQPDGALLAVPYRDFHRRIGNTVLLWDVRSQRQVRILRGLTGDVRDVAFSPDGARLACVGNRKKGFMAGEIKSWETEKWRCLWTVETELVQLGSLRSVAFSSDGTRIAIGSACGGAEKIGLLNAESGQLLRSFAVVHPEVSYLTFSLDDKSLAAACSPDVTVWSTATGEAQWSHRAHPVSDLCLAFAPNGRALASCGDRTTVVWDVAAGEPLRFLKGHEGDVRALAFSADGRTLATGSHDGLRVWDVHTGEAVLTLEMAGRHPVWVGFWPEPEMLTAVDYTLQIYTWNLAKVAKSGPRVTPVRRGKSFEDPGLLAAILDSPEDDALHLVYADWLEEHGDPDRAELIRLQCELAPLREQWKLPAAQSRRRTALTKREQNLLAAHRSTWLEPLASIAPQIDEAEFRRGFLWKLRLTGIGVSDQHLAALRAVPELEVLDLENSSVTDAGLAHLRSLDNLRHLILSGTSVTVAGLAPLRELKKLVLVYNCDWGNDRNSELEGFKAARNRHFLCLPARARRAEALRAVRILASTVHTEASGLVRAISFSQSWITESDLVYLRELPELESLDFFEDRAITMTGLAELTYLKNLKRLILCETGVTDVEPLRHLTGLEELDLSSLPRLDPESLRHLQPLKRLRKLSLFNGELDDRVMPHLGRLSALEELELAENKITDEGLEHLAGLENLKRLDVDYRERRKDLLRRLVRSQNDR
jgi:uncharacterized protein (TIGR02996 family)